MRILDYWVVAAVVYAERAGCQLCVARYPESANVGQSFSTVAKLIR